jgi:hypothetical protein
MRRWTQSVLAAVALVLAPARSHAQSAEEKAAAEVLFDEARALMQEKQYSLACQKLAESNRLDAGLGTVLWLADCYEKNGQSASAWAEFREAQDLAAKNHDAREKIARERADRLQPMLSKMTIVVAAPAVSGLVVKRDADEVGKSQWGVAVPVDPGPHKLVVTAPRKKTWEQSVFVPAGVNIDVPVPVLATAPPPPPGTVEIPTPDANNKGGAQPVPQPSTGGGGGQRAIGGVVMGLGLAGVGAGTVLAVIANQSIAQSNNTCDNKCKSAAEQDAAYGKNETIGSAISFAVGGALLVTGLVVILTAPSGKSTNVSLAPWVRSDGGGLGFGGTFE